MNEVEFNKLSNDLRELVIRIPLVWGAVQNNGMDSLMTAESFFKISSYEELEKSIVSFPDAAKNYFRRRWYILQCSRCDEYLFAINPGVTQNPDPRDKSYDIAFGDYIKFDVKGTRIPNSMKRSEDSIAAVLSDPYSLVGFYYDQQSKGVRFDMQNRLFIVHHSFINDSRELYLRCAWQTKREIYGIFSRNISSINFINYKNCKAAVIFILERELNKLEFIIPGLNA